MKQLVSVPINAYLFWRIKRSPSLKHCISQYGRFFSAIKAAQGTREKVFTTAGPLTKRQTIIGKMFSSSSEHSFALMDFDVWLAPKVFNSLRGFFNYLLALSDMDSFSLGEFSVCSGKALHVVANLLSELRFSELEGLLTTQCKQEVEKNVRNWSTSYTSSLAFKPEQVLCNIPCDFCIISDKGSNEKSFVEIRVIHYVWLQFSPEFLKDKESFDLLYRNASEKEEGKFGNVYMAGVFNCKFIREITKGTSDQWTINAINLKINPKMLSRRKF